MSESQSTSGGVGTLGLPWKVVVSSMVDAMPERRG